ncbi:IS66 family insertion sequence element accessory protein TnpA [Photobacterium sp. DNB23_23_1]
MTREDKTQLWQERLQHQRDSELTIAGWCEQHQIAQSQFYYWQKKLTTTTYEPSSTMVPISIPSSSIPLVIETPGGYRISINDTSAISLLPQVMKSLP